MEVKGGNWECRNKPKPKWCSGSPPISQRDTESVCSGSGNGSRMLRGERHRSKGRRGMQRWTRCGGVWRSWRSRRRSAGNSGKMGLGKKKQEKKMGLGGKKDGQEGCIVSAELLDMLLIRLETIRMTFWKFTKEIFLLCRIFPNEKNVCFCTSQESDYMPYMLT